LFTAASKGYNDLSDGNNSGASEPGGIRKPDATQLIGNGVIDFGVRIYTRSAAGILEEAFPVDRRGGGSTARQSFVATTDTTKIPPSGSPSAAQTSYGYPAVVEVMVRVLTPDGVEIMQAYEANPNRFGGASLSKWWELAEANSRVYIRRVDVRSTAL